MIENKAKMNTPTHPHTYTHLHSHTSPHTRTHTPTHTQINLISDIHSGGDDDREQGQDEHGKGTVEPVTE